MIDLGKRKMFVHHASGSQSWKPTRVHLIGYRTDKERHWGERHELVDHYTASV